MLKIRMQRTGRRNQPAYRIVVIDSHAAPKSGNFIEKIGYYDPLVKKREIKTERVMYWIQNGALLSDTVHNFCITDGVLKGKKRNALPKHTVQKKEEEETQEQSAPVQAQTAEDPANETASAEQSDSVQVEDNESKDTAEEKAPTVEPEATEGPPGEEPEVAKT